MKKIIFISTAVLLIVFSACSNSSTNKAANDSAKFIAIDTAKLNSGATFYQCPMHPEVTSDKSGICPKCNMDLEKVEKK
ncbi:MAG: hypothetical protein NT084_14425 [Bacteroidetes bacterium]|jgi:hypothetical protein|nr:hypothetical protein [Bacteroidota bacterium]